MPRTSSPQCSPVNFRSDMHPIDSRRQEGKRESVLATCLPGSSCNGIPCASYSSACTIGKMKKIGRNVACPCNSGKKYKKCHGLPAQTQIAQGLRNEEVRVRAFTDETENSGNNLFDSGQPYFWTGTLVCGTNVQEEAAPAHADCLRITGQAELHGNALGLGGIEKIAPILRSFFLAHDCRFFFTRIDKVHLAATKLFDVLMDSGINKAVTNLHYAMRSMRLPLAVQLIQIIDDTDRREFWEAYRTGHAANFRTILARIRVRLLDVHAHGLYHDRTVQLLRDGLEWGIAYPEPLLEQKMGELDSPNIVAFSLLISMFHQMHEETGAKVESFVHDEQNQFGTFLRESYKALKHLNFKHTITATMLDITELPTFDCEFAMCKSKDSIGLQFIDVGLWLIKRFRDTKGEVRGNCRALAEVIIGRGLISGFTLRDMQQDVIHTMRKMEKEPWPADPERMEFARRTIQEMEEVRQRRMKEPPDPT